MANTYLTSFNTNAEYEAATLELPNVSLIKSTGEVKYKNIFAGAVAGDVLMWDVANNVFKMTLGGQWDATTYPIASYVPVAVNVIPSSEASDGVTRWTSLNDLGSLRWGDTNVQIGGISDQNALSGRNYTNTVLNFTGYNASDYAAFNAVNTFVTSGTSAGDWFLPSLGELKVAYTHKSEVNASLAALHSASSSVASEFDNNEHWSSSECSNNYAWRLGFSSGQAYDSYKGNSGLRVRAFLAL